MSSFKVVPYNCAVVGCRMIRNGVATSDYPSNIDRPLHLKKNG